MRSIKVLIAGGGIGGLALALALRERGIDAEVFERAKSFGNFGSGIELTPNGVKSIDRISPELGAAVRQTGWSSDLHEDKMPIMSWDGSLLKNRDLAAFSTKWGAPLVGILRAELHRLLYEMLAQPGKATVTVHHNATVVDAESTKDSATIRLADGRTFTGDVIVGADGVRSAVRATVDPDAKPNYLGFTSVRGISKRPATFSDGFIFVGPLGHFFAEAVNSEVMFWTATVHCPEGTWPAKGPEKARAEVLELWSGWHQLVSETISSADINDIVVTDVHDCPLLKRWQKGRVVLLGDAAHPIGPVLGQGANMALEDAARLADLLASDRDIPAVLKTYERMRTQRTDKIVQHSRLVAKFTHTTNPVMGWIRDMFVKWLNRDETYRDKELFSYQP